MALLRAVRHHLEAGIDGPHPERRDRGASAGRRGHCFALRIIQGINNVGYIHGAAL